MEENFFHQWTL